MSNDTHETVPTQFVEAEGSRYAYRRFGKAGTIPLLFLAYFNSNMDGWDPAVTNGLAADHEVMLFDIAGVGASGGETPDTVVEMTHHCVAFCRALGLKAMHVVGFSLGGMIAQQLALDHPHLVQRLILLGTGPRGGEGMTFTELSPEEQTDPVAFLLEAFFSPSAASQAAGREYMKRLDARTEDRDLPVSRNSAVAQLAAIREWGTIPATSRYATLKHIPHPTLIVHGNQDSVVAPINALILAEHLPNAQLIVYPDSSHGAQYQHAKIFLDHVKLFLSDGDAPVPAPVDGGSKRCNMSVLGGSMKTTTEQNKRLVLEAFDTLFNKRDYAAAEKFWSPHYIQHSAHIEPGREGLFNLVKSLPPTLKYEPGTIVADGDFVLVHGRFSGFLPVNWIAADILRIQDGMLAEHWDVIQDEATKEESKSGLPMFDNHFSK